jgi:hypothetical protein
MHRTLASFNDVLQSPAWSVGATLLAAVAIIVAVALARQQRSRKSLTFEIRMVELVSVHSDARDRIKVLYEEEEIEQAHLLQLWLRNNGNVPVLEADFEAPFELVFAAEGRPLTVETSCFPDHLGPRATIDGSRVRLEPLLLNPGDVAGVQVFISNFTSLDLEYRIVGVPKITETKPSTNKSFGEILAESLTITLRPLGISVRDLRDGLRKGLGS